MKSQPDVANRDIPDVLELERLILPAVMEWSGYDNDACQEYAARCLGLTDEQRGRPRKSGSGTVLQNRIAFVFSRMTMEGLHEKIGSSAGQYRPIPRKIRAYCSANDIDLPGSIGTLQDRMRLDLAGMPESTEVERLTKQRKGQDMFRALLMQACGGRCVITGIDHPVLLRASHIRPWSESSDKQRLDINNGLLLSAHIDAAFDGLLITFDPAGRLLRSARLTEKNASLLGLSGEVQIQMTAEQRAYMADHRARMYARDRQGHGQPGKPNNLPGMLL